MKKIIRTGVCFFVHDGDGKYLIHTGSLSCRDKQGRWGRGAGEVKFAGKIEDALRREIQEEFRARILEIEFLGYRDVFRGIEASAPHWVVFDFRVKVDFATVTIGEPHKMDGLKWMSVPELFAMIEPVHSQFFPAIEKNKKYFA